MLNTLTCIADQTQQPFVLLRLRTKHIDSLCGRLLEERRGLLLSLSEATLPNEHGAIEFTQPAIDRIQTFQQAYLPKASSKVAKSGFSTPPKCPWSAIKIRFLDIDTVSITAAGVVGRYHFTEMGFARAGNKRSNIQWELLRLFAKSYGTMTWTSPGASRQNQKRKERLSEALCKFFGISDDPIRWMPDRCGWQTLFALIQNPDDLLSQRHVAEPRRSFLRIFLFEKPMNSPLTASPAWKFPRFFGFSATCRQSQATGQQRFDKFTLPQ